LTVYTSTDVWNCRERKNLVIKKFVFWFGLTIFWGIWIMVGIWEVSKSFANFEKASLKYKKISLVIGFEV